MTEGAGLFFLNHRLYTNSASIGWPVASTDAKIVSLNDPSNRGLDANISGELLIRCPTIMAGFWKNPEATAKATTENGWFRTGDIAMYDNNGDFYITDRAKDLIKVQAYQVAPAELEEIVRSHPNVLDAAVIGVKNEKFGEVPKAFVVIRKGATVSSKDIQEYIEKRCVKYKWLVGGVHFIAEVPKSKTGKILKTHLRTLYER